MKNVSPMSDHVFACWNDGKWCARVMIDGETLYFEEFGGDIRLTSQGGHTAEIGVRRNAAIRKAMQMARTEYTISRKCDPSE
jgi:hypothetical protein